MAPAGTAVKLVAVACYVAALAGAGAFGALVLLLGGGALDPPPRLSTPAAVAVNLLWLVAFALQHSGMAREGFKRRWVRFVPRCLERAVYAGASGLLLLGLAATWQPVGGPALWRGPGWLMGVPLAAGAGLALINLRYGHAEFFGLREAWGRPAPPERLLVTGPYRFVRHPLMACLIVFLWAQPVMTPTLALLSGGLSAYVVLGLILEEGDLVHRFPAVYPAYRARVPALLPWRRPAPARTHPGE